MTKRVACSRYATARPQVAKRFASEEEYSRATRSQMRQATASKYYQPLALDTCPEAQSRHCAPLRTHSHSSHADRQRASEYPCVTPRAPDSSPSPATLFDLALGHWLSFHMRPAWLSSSRRCARSEIEREALH